MSTVVGDCTDCIVSLPVVPKTSLKFGISVARGYNGVIQQSGLFSAVYTADNIAQQSGSLATGASFTPQTSTTGYTAICLSVNQPCTLLLTKGSSSLSVTVNQVLVLDDTFTGFTITNPTGTLTTLEFGLSYIIPAATS